MTSEKPQRRSVTIRAVFAVLGLLAATSPVESSSVILSGSGFLKRVKKIGEAPKPSAGTDFKRRNAGGKAMLITSKALRVKEKVELAKNALPADCDCVWTSAYACPGEEFGGTKGYANDDGSECFAACCLRPPSPPSTPPAPPASPPPLPLATRFQLLIARMLLNTESSALLPSLPPGDLQSSQNNTALVNGQLETVRAVFHGFTQANGAKLTNLTSVLTLYFSKLNPAQLNTSWTADDQQAWLGSLLLLRRRAKYKTGGAYLKELIQKVNELVSSANVLPQDFKRELEADFASMKEELAALEAIFQQGSPGDVGGDVGDKALQAANLFADTADVMGIEGGTGLVGMAIATYAAPGVAGGAATSSGLAAIGNAALNYVGASGAVAGGGMATGPVVLALLPIAAGVLGTNMILPDDEAGRAGKYAADAAGVAAPFAVYCAVTCAGASATQISAALASWGGANAVGVAALGGAAIGGVLLAGLGVYGSYRLYEQMHHVDDVDPEMFECPDCSWTSTYACPSTQTINVTSVASNDGSPCFHYCCEVVEPVVILAKEIIHERDALADQVLAALERYRPANLAKPPRSRGIPLVSAQNLRISLALLVLLLLSLAVYAMGGTSGVASRSLLPAGADSAKMPTIARPPAGYLKVQKAKAAAANLV